MTKQNPANSSATRKAMVPLQDPHSRPTVLPSQSDMKRKLTNLGVRYSSFIRIRTLIQELRPLLMEVLRTPDFRNCKAAHEIRAKIKLMKNEYNQMTIEKNKAGRDQDGKQQKESVLEKSAKKDMFGSSLLEGKHLTSGCPDQLAGKGPMPLRAVKCSRSGNLPGSYIVGGSASGRNFITYGGNKPRYYGVTKKSFRKKMKKPP